MLGRLRHGIPAAPTNFLSRRTSACKDNASFAVRRIASVSARASVSLSRLASHWTFQQPARLRAAISARRHCSACASATSARASASSARARSRSYTKHQSRHSLAGTDSGSDRIPSPPSISVSSVPTSASQVAMRATIAQSRFRYQSPGNRTVTFKGSGNCCTYLLDVPGHSAGPAPSVRSRRALADNARATAACDPGTNII